MKLLVVLPWMPYPLNDGGKQGSFNMLEQLQYKLDIVLIYPVESVNQLKYQMELQERLLNIKIYPFMLRSRLQSPNCRYVFKKSYHKIAIFSIVTRQCRYQDKKRQPRL